MLQMVGFHRTYRTLIRVVDRDQHWIPVVRSRVAYIHRSIQMIPSPGSVLKLAKQVMPTSLHDRLKTWYIPWRRKQAWKGSPQVSLGKRMSATSLPLDGYSCAFLKNGSWPEDLSDWADCLHLYTCFYVECRHIDIISIMIKLINDHF